MNDDTVQRSLKVDLTLPPDHDGYRRIISSIRSYRATLRHCYGILASARSAGANITWTGDDCRLTPNAIAGQLIAALSTGQATATRADAPADRQRGTGDIYHVRLARGQAYEVRSEIARQLPTVYSFVNDSARRDLHTAWTSLDPEFPAANRGWLTLQGARGIAQFNRRGIGFPVATARPRLENRSLILKWDREIGEIPFRLAKLDGGRWRTWESIRDGEYTLGTIYLSERDGKLFATISHARPVTTTTVDPNRIATVSIPQDDSQTLMNVSGPDGTETFGTIDSADVLSFLAYQLRKRLDLEARRGACGAPRRPWGFRKGWDVAQTTLSRATVTRDLGVKDRNNAWTRRIVDWAVHWRCGVVKVATLPTRSFNGGSPVGSIGEHPWNWHGFKEMLRYKAADVGVSVVFEDE